MNLLFKISYLLFTVFLLVYISLPSPNFPEPPEGAVQSKEPADTETTLRRAYFLDASRDEVIAHYKSQFSPLPFLRLNYPPEEAQSIIRDQTRSSYLEELVHPLRESVFINGFVPEVRKDAIVIEGREYYQKITVRYVPAPLAIRIAYILLTAVLGYLVIIWSTRLWAAYLGWFKKSLWKLKRR